MDRHLTVILYADVVGYSRLTAMNEERTHQQLSFGLNLLSANISAHGGKKVHEAGDAILAEFISATAAVEAAMQFQKLLGEHAGEVPEGEAIVFRIGINIGEVIRDRDDIYGDGVNIAARIQDVAPPGGVCVSGAVFDQLSSDLECSYDDLGYRDFKNIKRPIHVYRVRPKDPFEAHPMAEIETRIQGQPLFDDAITRKVVTRGKCACGSIGLEITQGPLGT